MTIEFKLVNSASLTRHHCHVCGGCTEKVSIHCMSDEGLRICESCLESRDFDSLIQKQICRLEVSAVALRDLIGEIDAPTFEEWEAACQAHEEEFIRLNGLEPDLVQQVPLSEEDFDSAIPF